MKNSKQNNNYSNYFAYFDNAATSFPKPKILQNNITKIFTNYGGNPGRSGHILAMKTSMMVHKTRETVADFFNAHNVEDVIFTSNCTMAINIALKGILKPGDHVIISSFEHNAVLRPLHKLKKLGLISYDIAQVHENNTKNTLDSFQKLIKPNTKLIICVHGSNVFGNILPIKQISEIAHQNGAMFMLDAAQTAGVLPIDIQDLKIDFLAAPGHKSLYGLAGIGLLITHHGQELSTIVEGGTGSASKNFLQPDFLPDKLESGTNNTAGILSLYYGISFIKNKNISKIYSHELKIAQYIYSRLAKNNKIILYTQFPQKNTHLPVLSFNVKNSPCDQINEKLSRHGFALRAGLHCSPLAHASKNTIDTGTVRISIGAFNTLPQAKRLCDLLNKL